MPKHQTSLTNFAIAVLIFFAMSAAAQTPTAGSAAAAEPASAKSLKSANDFHVFTNATGSGTAGKIAKWTDSSGALGDSVITESSGNIGIGTSPLASLHVSGISRSDNRFESRLGGSDSVGSGASIFFGDGGTGALWAGMQLSAGHDINFWTQDNTWNSPKVTIKLGGSVGIGTTTPGSTLQAPTQVSPLHIYTSADKNEFLVMQNASNTPNAVALVRTWADVASVNVASHASSRTVTRWGTSLGGWNEVLALAGNGLAVGTYATTPLILGTNSTARLTIDSGGNVTVGNTGDNLSMTVNGTLTATKVIGATYQDVAEWVPATTHMEPGTVVVLNRERNNEVMPSAHAYDTAVAGVVSAQPGLILGVAGASKAQVATTGRVKVHVDAGSAGIAIGDLLVTSDRSGTAMKSQPVDLGGVQFHRPGTVIGKALEPLPTGEGEILVLLSLQ